MFKTSSTTRCRAKIKDACPFHGNAFYETSGKRIQQYLNDVREYKLPRNLSVFGADWKDRETHAFASAVVANSNPNLHFTVKAQMLEATTATYNRYLHATERMFATRKHTELAKSTDEATKIAALSTFLSSQILGAKAEADRLRHELWTSQRSVPQENRRRRLGAQESEMLANEALAYRLTEVRNGLDKQLKRSAAQVAPPAIPDWDWFSKASAADLEKAALTPARTPVDWTGGKQLGANENVWGF